MKKVNLTGYGLIAALVLAASCDDGLDTSHGTGTIAPLVDYDPTVISARSASGSRAAEIGDLTVDELTLTLVSEDGTVNESFPATEFPTDRGFKVGKYTLTASYGDPEAEGFELPAVKGEAELSVNEGKTTSVALTATPSKAMVTVKFDSSLTDYMTSYSARLHTPGGAYIDYAASETRPVYLRPGQVELTASFVKPNGVEGTIEVANFTAQPKTHYTVTLKLGGNGAGTVDQLIVSYDETLTEEDVIVDISDLVLITPAPVVTPEGFTNGQLFSCTEGSTISATPRFKIDARGGIAKAVLTTSCPSLIEQGWPAEVDLANAPASTQALMTSLGLKDMGLFRNPDKMAAVDLSGVPAHIAATSTNASPAEFTLVVTDKNGKVTDPLGFKVKVDKLELNIASAIDIYDGASTVDLTVGYNGSSALADAVKFEYLNRSGVFAPATVASVTAKSRALPEYTVKVNIPADAKAPLTLRATCGTIVTPELIIHTAPLLSVDNNDVFARSAWVTLQSDEYNCATKTIELYASTNGKDFTKLSGTQSGADYHITGGLNPATTYTLRATVDGTISRTVSITTETAAQLANGNLNDGWSDSENATWGAYKVAIIASPAPWANTNKGMVKIGASGRGGYNATQWDDNGREGRCAVLYTAHTGAIPGTPGIYGKPESFAFGEMFLGTYNNGAQRGQDFTSRPAGLKFWYKYAPYLTDEKGVAEIKVLDADGNVIASTEKLVASASNWAETTVVLNYKRGSAKASKIEVNFKSSNAADAKTATPATEKGKYHTGAAFHIDDIELVY